MTQHLANKRTAKIGFERIGAVVAVLVLLAVVGIVLSTMMTTARSAADPNTPSVDVRTTAIQEAKTRPPT
jgi:hypothetical protein